MPQPQASLSTARSLLTCLSGGTQAPGTAAENRALLEVPPTPPPAGRSPHPPAEKTEKGHIWNQLPQSLVSGPQVPPALAPQLCPASETGGTALPPTRSPTLTCTASAAPGCRSSSADRSVSVSPASSSSSSASSMVGVSPGTEARRGFFLPFFVTPFLRRVSGGRCVESGWWMWWDDWRWSAVDRRVSTLPPARPLPTRCPRPPLTLKVLLAVAAPSLFGVAGMRVTQDLLEALHAQCLVQVLLLLFLPEHG